jgi:hypothetical protein
MSLVLNESGSLWCFPFSSGICLDALLDGDAVEDGLVDAFVGVWRLLSLDLDLDLDLVLFAGGGGGGGK